MRSDLTDLTMVIDRSGSMSACKADAEGGVNEFIKQQQRQPGECLFSLVQFDDIYEKVHDARPIKDVTLAYVMQPRGGTALLDAIGRAITETGQRLSKMNEADRPGLVVFAIITDGAENRSKEYTRAKLKQMIELQTNVYKWQFTFLGANQDAFSEAGMIGIARSAVANFDQATKTSGAIELASNSVSRMRGASFTGAPIVNAYADSEREAVK